MPRTLSDPLDVSRETRERLRVFTDLLVRWNVSAKLVSGRDLPLVLERHIADSLAILPFLGDARKIGDLGSGAGFPGLVLAIASGRTITLIEADRRRVAFLREAIRLTQAPSVVKAGRIEEMPLSFDLLTARAVASLDRLLALAKPHLTPGGRCLFPKGQNYRDELRDAERHWQFAVKEHPSATSAESRILEISDIHRKPVS